MKLIKILAKALYLVIIFIIIIYGSMGIGTILSSCGINGISNTILQFAITIYGLGMFAYDVNKTYKEN